VIKEKKVNVKIGSWTLSYYKELGYKNISKGDLILVDINHLTKSSHTNVTAICDYCGTEKIMSYKTYNTRIKKYGKYNCKSCCYSVMKNNMLIKYGVDNVSYLEEVKDKIRIKNTINSKDRTIKRKKTCLIKYGVENTFQSNNLMKGSIDKVRETNIKNGRWVSDVELCSWLSYKRKVYKFTRRNKKTLLEAWDGFDYYDNEYIKNNFSLHFLDPNYPTIDHKISVKYGFDNEISPKTLSKIDNLCFTKKSINTRKYTKNEEEFVKRIDC